MSASPTKARGTTKPRTKAKAKAKAAPAADAARPFSLLVAALGGEGGGVLTDWIVRAAEAQGYPVQSTSIPGVAQRTGATTYYIEMLPARREALGGRVPVLALYPSPGHVDVMLASELLEAGRALENGFVSPDRTTLVASTHRIYAIAEKSAMADGSYDVERVLDAGRQLAKRAVLADLAGLARAHGSVLNAALLGVIAGTEVTPVPAAAYETAIRERGVAVESNLRGFAAGMAFARGELEPPAEPAPRARSWADAGRSLDALTGGLAEGFPEACHGVLAEGLKRLADYQDLRYAGRYLDWLGPVLAADRGAGGDGRAFALTREAGRHLALWMSYEDVVRVAELKSRASRREAVRAEVGAKPHEPVRVTEFLKPGVEEIGALLPPILGRRLVAWAERRGISDRLRLSVRLRSDTVWGHLRLRMLAGLKGWRRRSYRFAEEQELIERWLVAVVQAAGRDYELALEVAECANLLKGYGETHARGRRNFLRILDEIVKPALVADGDPRQAEDRVRRARQAALADPEGDALETALAGTASGDASAPTPAAHKSDSRPVAAE